MSGPHVAFDLTPIQNAHRFRGVGTYVRGLAERLAAQSEVPIEFWGWRDLLPIEVRPPHRTLLTRSIPRPSYRLAWAFERAAMRLRAGRSTCRVVHITDPQALVPLRGVQLLTTVYDLIPLREGIPARQPLVQFGYRTYLRNLRRTDGIFVISKAAAMDISDRLAIPLDRIVIARPGTPPVPRRIAAPGGPSESYFLFVGGPNLNKNLGRLLDALGLCDSLPEQLLIAGAWLDRDLVNLHRMLAARGELGRRVKHVGYVGRAALDDYMLGATALVLPSLSEGFGLTVAEAMARGVPVVHSDIAVLNEMSAGSALTFDPYSAQDLARSLRRISTDAQLRRELKRRGRARAAQLTWDPAVAATLAEYERHLRFNRRAG